jgi:deazaflavin-dependent oxidoreductase (nitroreductase family)
MEDGELEELDYCYVTTTGRRSGKSHTIEIWFALRDGRVYLLSGGGDANDWVKNLRANPTVGVRIGDRDMICRAFVVEDAAEDELARRLLLEKYAPRYSGELDDWARSALPVAVVLPEPPSEP